MLFKTQGIHCTVQAYMQSSSILSPPPPSEVSCAPCALCRPATASPGIWDQPRIRQKCWESRWRSQADLTISYSHIFFFFLSGGVEALPLTPNSRQSHCRGNGMLFAPMWATLCAGHTGLKEMKLQRKAIYLNPLCFGARGLLERHFIRV